MPNPQQQHWNIFSASHFFAMNWTVNGLVLESNYSMHLYSGVKSLFWGEKGYWPKHQHKTCFAAVTYLQLIFFLTTCATPDKKKVNLVNDFRQPPVGGLALKTESTVFCQAVVIPPSITPVRSAVCLSTPDILTHWSIQLVLTGRFFYLFFFSELPLA